MNRRSFFKSMVGGVAAAAAVRTFPFRVFSFPKEITLSRNLPLISIRFVRTYDPIQACMVSRFDALYGFGPETLELPRHTAYAEMLTAEMLTAKGVDSLSAEHVDFFKLRCEDRYLRFEKSKQDFEIVESLRLPGPHRQVVQSWDAVKPEHSLFLA